MKAVHGNQPGGLAVDSAGSTVAGARMDASKAYAGIPVLLQKVIDHDDALAWNEIKQRIDFITDHLDKALSALDTDTGFAGGVQSQVRSGKKLLFKPNLVSPTVIDSETHGEGPGSPICTEWALVAALMRWFHDRLDIPYSGMAVGEASTTTFFLAHLYGKALGKPFPTEAIFEGKNGDFNGGWGLYYIRRYLAESLPASSGEDPMKGYEESLAGTYIPPGRAEGRLMVYDLNKIQEDRMRGRTVPVPGGAIYKEITLHKAIVGGNPNDAEDMKDYPGCVLVNVPKLKIHAQDLITSAIKNLGIGLYPTQCANGTDSEDTNWKYSCPPTEIPSYKGKLPHSPWVLEMDPQTNLPKRDEKGNYIGKKTAGFSGTQSDIVRAVQSQGVFMVHVVDAIDTINISHNPDGQAVRIPEGYVWASLDCVAVDLLCARTCFKTLPMAEARKLKEENGWPTEFVRHVPVAKVEGANIVTGEGLDSPLFRYDLYRYAEDRGVGQQAYHVTGWDAVTETPLASLDGHLGRVEDGKFVELITKTMYYNPLTFLHDMQKTVLSYAKASDELNGTSYYRELMETFDENGDGVIDYDEKGRGGLDTAQFSTLGMTLHLQATDPYGGLKGPFLENVFYIRNADPKLNAQGHDFAKGMALVAKATVAFNLSRSETVSPDPFFPGMSFGKGRWPSLKTVEHLSTLGGLYGLRAPGEVLLGSLYGQAFLYADKTLNAGGYSGSTDQLQNDPACIGRYFEAVAGGAKPLDFTLYVPRYYGSPGTQAIPNVQETDDPGKVFTVRFGGGKEVW
jgi:hypothetical protein